MIFHNFKDSFGWQEAQVVVLLVRVNYLEHPQNSRGVDDFFLVGRLMHYIEIYYV